MINGNDGGATVSVDGGKNWTTQNNQPTAQFYHVAADNDFLYRVYGSQQDNSSVSIATRTDHGYIGPGDFMPVGGGESGYVVPDPRNSNIVYADDEGPFLTRFDRATGQAQSIQQWPEDISGHSAGVQKYRYTWTMPIVISSHNPDVIYHASQYVFRSSDAGNTWTEISPDLTRNDKSKQQDSGGPITKDQYSVEYYDVVFALAESPKQADVLWAGTDDGVLQLTRDGGKNWSNVTPKEVPPWSAISLIDASPFDPAIAYVAVDAHKLDDFHPLIFKTTDFGKTWSKIIGGLPDNSYVHAVREDPARKGLLYAGTETGVWVSFNDGANWQPLQLNLPNTPIHDLIIHNDDLIVATHGRSFWVLDDVGPLRQLTPAISSEPVHLFAPSTAIRSRIGHRDRRRYAIAENPPQGAMLYYWLKEKPKEPIKVEILDDHGKTLRTVSSAVKKEAEETTEFDEDPEITHMPAEAGLNLFVWDLRGQMPVKIPVAIYDNGKPTGPLLLPGTYQVRLAVAGKFYTASIEIKMDPRIKTSPDDLRKQFDLLSKLRDTEDELNKAILGIRDLNNQLQALEKRLGSVKETKAVADSCAELRKKIRAIEEELIQVNATAQEDEANYPTKLNSKLGYVSGVVDSADTAPTRAELEVFAQLDKQLQAELNKWREVLSKDLPALNDSMRKQDVAVVGSWHAEEQQ
jgi:photosystem II stability/assembly factor-like uncharacterized protein